MLRAQQIYACQLLGSTIEDGYHYPPRPLVTEVRKYNKNILHRHDLEALRAVFANGSSSAHPGKVLLRKSFIGAARSVNVLLYTTCVAVVEVSTERSIMW